MRHSFISTSLVAIAAIGMIGLSGCGRDEPKKDFPSDRPIAVNSLPDWVKDPTLDGKYLLAAAGSAEKGPGGFSMQTTTASERARTELARTIESKVKAVFKDWTREGGEITTQDDRRMAMTMQENVAKNITDQAIKGSSRKDLHQDPTTGTLFAWLVVNPALAEQLKKDLSAQIRGEMEKRAHFAAKIEADKAFADLEKLIDKEMGVTK
jgi:hypothetical protein